MAANQDGAFNFQTCLNPPGHSEAIVDYAPNDEIFCQGQPSDTVMYVRSGAVQLSVVTTDGKEAVVGMLMSGAFFGEEVLAGRTHRLESAKALVASSIGIVPASEMVRLLRRDPAIADRFLAHVLTRTIRLTADLTDQLCNTSEKRLARILFLLAREQDQERPVLPGLSQQSLAAMVGTTRSRVNMFLNHFKRCGYIENSGGLRVHESLSSVLRPA